MTAREAETLRRKRVRREAREKAWREWACGGPLTDLDYAALPEDPEELRYRYELIAAEHLSLGRQFARECWVRELDYYRMVAELWRYVAPWAFPPYPPQLHYVIDMIESTTSLETTHATATP